MHIATPRLLIRELQLEDADDYHSIFGDPEIAKYDDYELTTPEEAIDIITEYIDLYGKNPVEIEYGVALKENSEVIGIINLNREDDQLFIGFHFKNTYQGKGYAFESLEAVIHHLEGPLFAKVDPENVRSVGLLHKLGFHFLKGGKIASGKNESIYTHPGK